MANSDSPRRNEPPSAERLRPEERAVIDALRQLSFGTLEVVVHQSRIVQLTRSEKQRFD
jgi:hypothetical protein